MPKPDQVFEVSARQSEWRIRYPSAERMKDDNLIDTFARESQKGERQADDVHVVNQIHIWKGAKVRIYLKTRDVLHSFFLPNLRIKQDAVPGKTIPVWFDSTEANTRRVGDRWEDGHRYDASSQQWVKDNSYVWELACAELCGWGHYKMRGNLYVHESQADFEEWLKQATREENRTTAKEN
jgi:cytochrome c oxidase subunit 2